MAFVWLAACSPPEGGGAVACRAPRRRRAGSEGQRVGRVLKRACAEAGEDRALEVVLARHFVVAEVVRQCQAQRSGRPPFHPIWERSGTGA